MNTLEESNGLDVRTIEQQVVTVHDLDIAADRMQGLFGALPSIRTPDYNAVYPFANNTFFELLGPVERGHTRERFLDRFGPGCYMICATLAQQDVVAVEREIRGRDKRIVMSKQHRNVRKTWHIHPRDGAGMLVLLAVKTDWQDNHEWAGDGYRGYVRGNTRYVDEIAGLIARCDDPDAHARGFRELGIGLREDTNRAQRWRGEGGTVLELWPADAWAGPPVHDRRDYAVVLRTGNEDALLSRLAQAGLTGEHGVAGNRWLSAPDPVLGVRFAVEALGAKQ